MTDLAGFLDLAPRVFIRFSKVWVFWNQWFLADFLSPKSLKLDNFEKSAYKGDIYLLKMERASQFKCYRPVFWPKCTLKVHYKIIYTQLEWNTEKLFFNPR